MNLFDLVKTVMPGTLVANAALGIKPFALSTENMKFFGQNEYHGVVARQPMIPHSHFRKDGWEVADEYPARTWSKSAVRKLAPALKTVEDF